MKNWFRWGYIVPRLVIVALLLVFSEYGAGFLLRYFAEQSAQAAVGAKVEIAGSSASLLSTHATLNGIAVTDPRDPMTNLLEADQLSLDFDSAAALRKKLVVSHGKLSGLRFGTARQTSGELPAKEETDPSSGGFQLPSLVGAEAAQQWLSGVEERFTADVQLESVRLAKQLREKWPAEYARLESRAKQLKRDIKQIKEQIKIARENPLRNVEFLQSVPTRLKNLKSELASIQAHLKQLPQQIESDRQAVLAARKQDEQLLREKLSLNNMDARSLSSYLLGDRLAGPMCELVKWLRWARKLAPSGVKAHEPARGVEIRFAGCRMTPNVLVHSLQLSGASRLAGRPLEFTGELTGLTSQPKLHGEPMLLSLSATGASPMEIRAKVDRSGKMAVDELIVDCPMMPLPQMQMGRADALGLTVAPSSASLSVSLQLTGEKISGDVQIVQRNVRVTPHVKSSLGGVLEEEALENALARHLAKTPKLVTSVSLSGQLDAPEWSVWSTAGPAVAEAMDNAVRTLAAERANRLLAKGQRAMDEQLAAFNREIEQMTSLVTASLGEPAKALASLSTGQGGKNLGGIGSRLAPVGSLFK